MTQPAQEPEIEIENEDIGELEIAEYLVFLLALDTYMRYVEEHQGENSADDLVRKGVQLVRSADRRYIDVIQGHLNDNLPSATHKRMLARAFAYLPTLDGITNRSFKIRTLLSLGGPTTMRSVFKTNKALKEMRDALAAASEEDADAALDKFAVISMRNQRLRKWINVAAEQAGAGTFQNPVPAATGAVSDELPKLYAATADKNAASPSSEANKQAVEQQSQLLTYVQENATKTAQRTMQVSGEPDVPPNRSEVVGIATAAVAAAMSDPEISGNTPAPLKSLDPEQRAAALTDGKVLVAAGAGAGKSTTLVSRIDYLVKERHTNPSRILACSFNKKAADELKGKIAKKLGTDDAAGNSAVQVGTMHSLFYRFIVGDKTTKGFGTKEEQAMLKPPRLIASGKKGVKSVSPTALSTAIRSMWMGCDTEAMSKRYGFPEEWLQEPPKAKKAGLLLNKWRGNDIGLDEAKASVTSKAEAQAYVWYEMYTGLKGDIPGWVPPCVSTPYQNFMKRHRPGNERLGDLDDMLKVFLNVLRRDPEARKTVQGMFDHVLVDEAQDSNQVQNSIIELMTEHIGDGSDGKSLWVIGDDKQCTHIDTLIELPDRSTLRAGDLRAGDKILAYRNGALAPQTVRHTAPSSWSWGYKVTTVSGKALHVTPNHKIWASPMPDDAMAGRHLVYLMYRQDLGFRVGVTNQAHVSDCNPYGSRPSQEYAERMWILSVEDSRDEALYVELEFSLAYSVPTLVFNGTNRGLNQERIDRVFSKFGTHGGRILEDRHLSFDLPHWFGYSSSRRKTIQLLAHGSKGSQVSLEWTGSDLAAKIRAEGFLVQSAEGVDRYRLRKQLHNYREVLACGERLARVTGYGLSHRLSVPDGEPLRKLTAASLLVGMRVLTLAGDDDVALEEIVAIERCPGTFVDIDVDDASNFFGGGILSSNSIYQFRGARPELFTQLDGKPGWKTRMIKTNYRCEPEIVETANRLIAHNETQLPMEARANPTKQRGKASIILDTPSDNTEAAIKTIGRVAKDMAQEDAKAENYAVLARTNAELDDFETACIINEIPYVRRGGKGFLEAPESKAVLGYIDLVNGNDYQKMRQSLVAVLMKPDRGLFLGPDDVDKAVGEALDDVARRERVDVRSVNPAMLLESRYMRDLADRLKQPYRLKIVNSAKDAKTGEFIYKKRVEELENNLSGLKDNLSDLGRFIKDGKQDTAGLLNYILDEMKSEVSGWDSAAKRATSTVKSLREQITHDTSIFSDGDDDEDSEDDEDEDLKPEVNEDGSLGESKRKKDTPEDEAKGLGAVRFLYQLAVPNDNDQQHNTDPSTTQGFVDKIARYSKLSETLRIDPDKWEKEQAKVGAHKKPPAITLATIHSCKGLEWPNVSVLMPKGKFPPERKPKEDEPPPDPIEEAEKLKAERNLAYVALTRAAVNLEVICPEASGGKPAGISPFVFEAGLVPGENVPKSGVLEPSSTKSAGEVFDPYVTETMRMFADAVDAYDRRVS